MPQVHRVRVRHGGRHHRHWARTQGGANLASPRSDLHKADRHARPRDAHRQAGIHSFRHAWRTCLHLQNACRPPRFRQGGPKAHPPWPGPDRRHDLVAQATQRTLVRLKDLRQRRGPARPQDEVRRLRRRRPRSRHPRLGLPARQSHSLAAMGSLDRSGRGAAHTVEGAARHLPRLHRVRPPLRQLDSPLLGRQQRRPVHRQQTVIVVPNADALAAHHR